MTRLKLNKNQLDILGSIFGAVAGVCTVLVTQQVGNRQIVGTVGGVATVLLGIVVQKPANASPNTSVTEEELK